MVDEEMTVHLSSPGRQWARFGRHNGDFWQEVVFLNDAADVMCSRCETSFTSLRACLVTRTHISVTSRERVKEKGREPLSTPLWRLTDQEMAVDLFRSGGYQACFGRHIRSEAVFFL